MWEIVGFEIARNGFKKIALYNGHGGNTQMLQSFTRYILQKNYGIKVSRMNLVVLHPDMPAYKVVPVPPMEREVAMIVQKIKNID